MTTALTLRSYQQAMREAVVTSLDDGLRRILLQAATGCGKTVSFASFLHEPRLRAWLESCGPRRGAFALIVAHREELLRQAQDKILRANPGMVVSIEQGDLYASRYSDVIVASIQTLAAGKCKRLLRLIDRHAFRLVIIDEAHHAPSPSYRNTLVHLGFLPPADATEKTGSETADEGDAEQMLAALRGWDAVAPKDRLLVGVTATPNRSDAIGLGCVFQSMPFSYPLKTAIADGWLVPIVPWVVETTTELDGVHIGRGDFKVGELSNAVNTPERNALAVKAWQQYAPGKPTLAFTVDIQHAHDLAAAFVAAGIQAAAVSGETDKDERRELVRRFEGRSLTVLTNCNVFTEGVDLPLTECVLMARPTKSATLYEQCIGRGLRTAPGKSAAIVIDLVDVTRKHSLQAAPVLYGLPPGLKTTGKSLQQVADDLDALREQCPQFDIDGALAKARRSVEDLVLQAKTFDIWSVPTLGSLAAVVSMNWIRTAADTYRLQYPWADGTEVVIVQPDLLGHFAVSLTLRPKPVLGVPSGVRQRTLAAQIPDLPAALKLAEQFIMRERGTVARLTDRTARWRQDKASPGQLAALAQMRITHNPQTLTKGEASNLMNLAKARRG